MWGDYENETLIHNHKMSKVYKKRYQRAGDFNNSLYSLFGLITVVSSAIASTISWGSKMDSGSGNELDNNEHILLSSITTISAISAAIQNFYKFQENSNIYFIMGADNLVNFHKWKKSNQIPKLCKILVFDRDGYKTKSLKSPYFKKYNKKGINFIKFKKVNISSSQLRKI